MTEQINTSTVPPTASTIAISASNATAPQEAAQQAIDAAPMITPRENDVLFGRGNGAGLHKGNVYFRQVIERYAPEYEKTANNMSKNRIAGQVRQEIEELAPAGRFLQAKNKAYYLTASEKTILEKIKQALRDRLKVNRNSQVDAAISLLKIAKS